MQARNGPRLLLINIEALSAVDEAFCLAEDFLKQRRVYFVIDESTTIKNESIRTERALKLGPLAEYRRILTGLISPRSPLDVFFQFQFLEPGSLGHRTYTSFKARYAIEKKMCTLPTGVLQGRLASRVGTSVTINGVMTQVTTLDRNSVMNELDRRGIWYQKFNTIVGYKNEDELRDRIAPHSFRVKLEDCYDLPPKLYSVRDIEMTPEQKRIYKSLKEKATAELTEMEHVTALSVVARMIRLHQVLCGHTRDEMDKLHEIPEKRTAALIDLLREVEGKAVIWASYDYNVRFISAALEEEFGEGCVARFWGGNEGTREEEEKIFQTDEACRFMIGTPAAGGRGRRWSAADTVIYFSNTNNLEHRSQSEERTQGIGKTESVVYIDLIVPDTVDARIIQALRDKIDMAATISGDTWKEWLI
jgi:SNF2 family DNA or RNA helicase